MSFDGMEGDAKRRYFAGDTLQQALIQAANYHNLNPEVIAWRAVEKRHGFLKVRRKVLIEVDPDAPRLAPGEVQPAAPAAESPGPLRGQGEVGPRPGGPGRGPRREGGPGGGPRGGGGRRSEREGRPEGDRGRGRYRGEREGRRGERSPRGPMGSPRPAGMADLEGLPSGPGMVRVGEGPKRIAERLTLATGPAAEAAAQMAEHLLRVAGLDLVPTVYQGEERLEIDLTGADVDWCFADDGELVMAIEHLLPRMIRSICGVSTPVRVDCDNFHEIREERLRTMAQRVAEDVRLRGRPRILEPMNPADRRVIHVTLADDPAVETESAGDGYFKRVTIRPLRSPRPA